MIMEVVEVRKGDILVIKTGWNKYGWCSKESDEFRYMVKHPGPSPDFSKWATEMEIKWIGVDAVSADHPMNTIMRIWHPKTFAEANAKLDQGLRQGLGSDVSARKISTRICTSTCSPRRSCMPRTWPVISPPPRAAAITLAAILQKAMEAESMWGRFVAFKE